MSKNFNWDWSYAFGSGRRGGGGNSPIRAGLQAWYDFTNAAYLTLASTAITQALDRSGKGNNTAVQGTGTARPTFTAAQINGLSSATFDGGDQLVLPAAIYNLPASSDITIITVSKQATASGVQETVISSSSSSTRMAVLYRSTASTVGFLSNDSGGGVLTNTATTTNFNILTNIRSGTTQSLAVNNGTAATNTNATNVTGITIGYIGCGGASPGNQFITGTISEILIYNRVLSIAEITQVNMYLANKYGIWVSGANWINAYSPWQQMLINAWQINKDNAFTNTAANPFAAIYDPTAAALGSTTSLADTGRGVNTATEVTNPPVNTAAAIGTDNGLLYNGTNTNLNAGLDATINNIFAAGGCYIGAIKPTTTGAGSFGRIFDKGGLTWLGNYLPSGNTANLYLNKAFSVTAGEWRTTNKDISLTASNIIAVTYDSSNVLNNPTMYVNSLTAKAVTTITVPTLTATSDAASTLRLGNRAAGDAASNGYFGKMVFLKSVPTTAQLTSVFNFLATEYGVTLT